MWCCNVRDDGYRERVITLCIDDVIESVCVITLCIDDGYRERVITLCIDDGYRERVYNDNVMY